MSGLATDTMTLPEEIVVRNNPMITRGQACLQRWKHNLVGWLSLPLRAFGSRAPADSFGILMYHRVCPAPSHRFPPTYSVRPEKFEAQLRSLIEKGYTAWPLSKLVAARQERQSIPEKVFAVTFDDGYENNYTHALPILQKLNIPATIFLATAYLDSNQPFPFDNWINDQDPNVPDDVWRPLTRTQCHELLRSGLIEFGCHTHSHADFRGKPDELAADLRICLHVLKNDFGIENPVFAYPYGAPDQGFSDASLGEVVRKSGCSCALQVGNSLVTSNTHPFHWPRFDVAPADNGASIAAKLEGWSEWIRGFWRSTTQLSVTSEEGIPNLHPEKNTKSSLLIRALTNRGGLALMDQAIVSGSNFLTSLCVGRLLGKESLGLLFITLGIFTLLQCITDQLVHVPFQVRAHHLERKRLSHYLGSSLFHTALLTMLAIVLIVGFSVWLTTQSAEPSQLSTLLLILCALLPGMMLREFIHSMSHNQLRQASAVALDASVSILQIGVFAWLILTNSLSLTTALLAVGGAASVVSLICLPTWFRRISLQKRYILEDFQQNWQIGRWTLGSYLIGSSSPTFLPWFLAYAHGTESTGLLAACMTLFGIAQTYLRGLGKYMGPQLAQAFAHGGLLALGQSLRRFVTYALLSISLIASVLAIFGPSLIQYAYGEQYSGTGSIMSWLAFGCVLQTLDVVTGNSLLALRRAEHNFRADFWRFLATTGLACWLIPNWGVLGVAATLVGGMFVGLLVRARYLVFTFSQPDRALEVDPNPACVSS